MEYLGAIQKHFVQERLSQRREERERLFASTAQMIFAAMHQQLGWTATPEEYQRALQTAVENARQLSAEVLPDPSEDDLRKMWQAQIN